MLEITRELEINMSMKAKLSFRKKGHPQNKWGGATMGADRSERYIEYI